MTTFDPRVALAAGLESQPGVYALLIGSGVSTAVGIPTGWGVVEALVRRLAAASGTPVVDEDWEGWWTEHGDGRPLGYSTLLESLAPTAAARKGALAGFFEPSEDERDQGIKAPGAAHRAIARLVARGSIRVIVTTNFDRLLEQALESEGIMPQVIASEAAIAGMEPLQHARATILKLHGDYASLDQRNTVDELQSYSLQLDALLRRVLDDYGLIVAGWSGEWDTALVAAIEATAGRRYPLYWIAREEASAVAKRLTARSGSQLITGASAESFFPDLLQRVEAVAALGESPMTHAVKLARLRRALPDPVRHLEVRELFEVELDALDAWVRDRPSATDINSWPEVDATFDDIYARFESLLTLYAQAIALDRDQQHTDLWVWVVQRALNARTFSTGTYTEWWEKLAHYPAFLLLRVGVMAGLTARHEDVIKRILGEPRWRTPLSRGGSEMPAHHVLHLHEVLNPEHVKELPRWGGAVYYYPSSELVRAQLSPIANVLVGEAASSRLLDRMEYRLAVASYRLKEPDLYTHNPAGGRFLGSWPYRDESQPLMELSTDFLGAKEAATWLNDGETAEELAADIGELDRYLRGLRRD